MVAYTKPRDYDQTRRLFRRDDNGTRYEVLVMPALSSHQPTDKYLLSIAHNLLDVARYDRPRKDDRVLVVCHINNVAMVCDSDLHQHERDLVLHWRAATISS